MSVRDELTPDDVDGFGDGSSWGEELDKFSISASEDPANESFVEIEKYH